MSTERDTHFQGAAELLHNKLQTVMAEGLDKNWNNIDVERRQKVVIARFLYDLVAHSLDYAQDDVYYPPQDLILGVPDLTAQPKPD